MENSAAPLTFAVFAPDGKGVLTASTDGKARVWDAATGNAVSVLTAHTGAVMSAQFDADGGQIVTASVDKTVRVWDAACGDLVKTFQSEPEDALAAASFSPDGRYVAAAASDGSARIIDADTGATLATLHRHGAAVHWAAFDAGGRQMVTASADGTARVWQVPTDLASKIECACGMLGPLTDEETALFGATCCRAEPSAQ